MKSKLAVAILSSLMLVPAVAWSNDYGTQAIEDKFDRADVAITQFNDIRAAVFMFFDEQGAFPANMAVLTDPALLYYAGNVLTPLGTAINGNISADGRFFEVSADFLSAEVANYVAQRLNTQAAGTSVVFSVGTPASQTLMLNSLSRTLDPLRPELNEMETNLSLGWNDINNIDVANANVINVANLVTTDQLDVLTNTTTLNLTVTNLATLNDTNINGTLTAADVTTTGLVTNNGNVVNNGTTTLNDVLTVNGASTFNDDINVLTNLFVGGDATVSGDLTVNDITGQNANLNSATITNGLTTKDLTVTNNASFKDVTAEKLNATDITGNTITATADLVSSGDLVVSGSSTLNDLIVNGPSTINGAVRTSNTLLAEVGIQLGDNNTFIGKSDKNDSVRLANTVGYVDIGTGASGLVEFETDANGYNFDKKVKVKSLMEVANGNSKVEIKASGTVPSLKFSRSGGDAEFTLTDPKTLTLYRANLNLDYGLKRDGQTVLDTSGNLYEKGVKLEDKYITRALAYTSAGEVNFGGNNININTAQFVSLLHGMGALDGRGWIGRGTWSYGSNQNITDSGFGIIELAGAVVEVMGTAARHTIRVTTATTGSSPNQEFVYVNNGSGFNAGWRKVFNNRNDGAGSGLDADFIDGINSNKLARTDIAERFNSTLTVDGRMYANGGIMVDGKWLVSNGGTTVYENGQALNQRYLGINATAKNSLKLAGVAANNYARTDIAERFNSTLTVDGYLYANRGLIVDGKTVISDGGTTIYENGQALNKRYLGINSKAKDADKIDNIDSSQLARTDIAERFNSTLTVDSFLYANRGLIVDGKTVISDGGTTIYENGQALNARYLGIDAKAKDAGKLGGIWASKYARTDIAETFNSNVTVGGYLYANRGLVVDGRTIVADGGNTLYEGRESLQSKYARLASANTFTQNQVISKRNAWLTLDSYNSGGNGTDQGAGISIGESGYKGSNALHLTYTGDGYSYIGMGSVSSSTNKPSQTVLRMRSSSNDAWFTDRVYANDYYVNSSIGGRDSLRDALTWIRNCENGNAKGCFGDLLQDPGMGEAFINEIRQTTGGANVVYSTDGSIHIYGTFTLSDFDRHVQRLPITVPHTNYFVFTQGTMAKSVSKSRTSFTLDMKRAEKVKFDYYVYVSPFSSSSRRGTVGGGR